jgi:ribonuclease HI
MSIRGAEATRLAAHAVLSCRVARSPWGPGCPRVTGVSDLEMRAVDMWTDGACKGNPGIGGWGAWMRFGGHEKELCGGETHTTNNIMELTAVIEGLKALKEPCTVTLHVDSTYVMNGIKTWIAGWKRNGWKTAAKKPVKNKELWQELEAQVARHQVSWVWVKGHAGDPGNERADALANKGVEQLRARN